MKRSPVRAGMVYVGVMIVCVVLVAGAFALHHVMRHGRAAAYRSLAGEHAAMLAHSGLAIAQVHLTRALGDPASGLRRRLLAKVAGGTRVDLGGADLVAAYPELVAPLARDLPHGVTGVAGLEARFGVSRVEPLPALTLADRTLDRGEHEKQGELYFEVTARVATGGPFGEVARTVRAYHQFRVASGPVPVLSDFSIFLEDRPPTGGWGKPSPIAKLEIDNGDWGSKFQQDDDGMDLDSFRSKGFVFLGDDDRRGGSGAQRYRPQLSRELFPSSWGDALDRFEPGSLTLAELAPQLARVACWNASGSATEFLERRGMLQDGRLDLGTFVRSAGPLDLPGLRSVRRGGVIMASRITITGAIPRPERGVLVLIATDGPIRIPAAVPVHASLIALKGAAVFQGAPEIHGNVVAVLADTTSLAPGARLSYDPRLKDRAFGETPTDALIVDFARQPTLVE